MVASPEAHRAWIVRHPDAELVDVADVVPGIRLALGYATADNFMGEVLYPSPRALLRRPAADALARVQEDLARDGLGLVVYDAYRPYAVTVRMWERIGDPDYVADPAGGSRHNRGAAVDVGLVDLATGSLVAMPTPWDTFSERAHHDFRELPVEVVRNRQRLLDAMTRHGFVPLATEWWHYDLDGWQRFPLLDLSWEAAAASAD